MLRFARVVAPHDGFVYKIPIEPPVTYKGQWFSFIIDEVYVMISPTERPRLLLFDDENKPYVVVFKHGIAQLLLEVNHQLQEKLATVIEKYTEFLNQNNWRAVAELWTEEQSKEFMESTRNTL